ncbi:MAG TPA: TIGR03557 family F420-dependent LLM class oxidoreductase [Acidimicrobiales bacterium]|jgi:G6PDH family F420-dependent oxidoreductase|nr:TIGR03557 family F420-dependent LLM class oxidoreductase [Acidimicrobiales bacterium]
MAHIGLFLSSEEHGPKALVDQAGQAEAAGFESVLISDHFHPWLDRQGESPFVWSVIGAIAATTKLKVTTGVTCPTVRIHPAVIAQATATSQLLLDGRFVFGVGSGEALNEHILGDTWPPVATRLEMLEEAVAVIRQMWTGELTTHHGRHYTVENARIYSAPDRPPPIVVSGFGPDATELAARIGDGFVTVQPDADLLGAYRGAGGKGPGIGAVKVCWDSDEGRAAKLAHSLWPTDALPGQLNQELSMPVHFEQASSLVTEEMITDSIPCGPDPERHARAIQEYIDAGFDEIYINQIGDDLAGFLGFWTKELKPRLGL